MSVSGLRMLLHVMILEFVLQLSTLNSLQCLKNKFGLKIQFIFLSLTNPPKWQTVALGYQIVAI